MAGTIVGRVATGPARPAQERSARLGLAVLPPPLPPPCGRDRAGGEEEDKACACDRNGD